MKRKSLFTGLITLSLFFTFSLGVLAAPKVSVWFNGKSKKVSVKIINKIAYIPLKDAVSWFGGKVTYDKNKNKYTVTSKDYKPPTKAKSYNVNVTKTSGPMQLHISKVTVDPSYKLDGYTSPVKALILDVKIKNTSSKKVTWYATGGLAALNTGEQVEYKIGLDEIDGEFLGNVTKSGKYLLKADRSNLDSIKSIQFNIDPPYNSNYDSIGNELLFTVKFR
jgi:lipopolysaccharide export system protein LptA